MCSGSKDPSQAWQLPFLAMYYRKREADDAITYQDILFQFTQDPEQYQPRDLMVKAQRPLEIIIVNGEVSAAPEDTDEVPDDQLRQVEDDGLLSTLWNISRSNIKSDSSTSARAESALMATYLMDRLNTTKQLENFTFLVIPCTHQVVISDAVHPLPAVRCRLKLPDWGRASETVLVVRDGPIQSVNIVDLESSGHVSAILGGNYLVPLKHTTVNGTSVLERDVLRIIRRWARSWRKTGRVLIEYSSTSKGPWQESGNGGGEKGETGQGVPFGYVIVFLKISKGAQQADPFRWRMDALSRETTKRNELGSGHQDTGNEPDNGTDVTDMGMREWSNASDVITGQYKTSSENLLGTCRVPAGYRPKRMWMCAAGIDECSQDCTNTDGTYTCGCPDGYELDSNERTCNDIDECSQDNPDCHECHNTLRSYECSCRDGFVVSDDGTSCEAPRSGPFSCVNGAFSTKDRSLQLYEWSFECTSMDGYDVSVYGTFAKRVSRSKISVDSSLKE
ncbi:hypothetical protein Bbelb_416360 [Branchiostoma belcheri]|nr:hypothetical protein Bbelb_416360 [Branchiostoma belcheri]